MSNTKYTPGPWRRIVFRNKREGFKIVAGERQCAEQVAEVTEIYMDKSRRNANAKLIAAAPELLEACEQLLTRINPASKDTWDLKAIIVAKFAIKKATE